MIKLQAPELSGKTLWTSCYGRIMGKTVRAVAITVKTPRGITFPIYPALAAPAEIQRLKPESFVDAYQKSVLAKLDPHETLELLNGTILCCYESPGLFSHRRIVAEWIERACGITVPEWGWEQPLPTVAQMIARSIHHKSDERQTNFYDALSQD